MGVEVWRVEKRVLVERIGVGSMKTGEREGVGVGVVRANMGKIEVGMSIGLWEDAGVGGWMEDEMNKEGAMGRWE